MIIFNERSTCLSGPGIPRRGMCSHAAGLNHNSANDAVRPVGREAFPLALGMCCSAARTEREPHATLRPCLVPQAAGWALSQINLLSSKVWDQVMGQSLENRICGCNSA